jgi:hypothetical protein
VSDWGLVSRIVEATIVCMIFQQWLKRERPWVALELFYGYSPSNFETSLERIQRRHMQTKEVDAYLVGKMAQHLWETEWDKDLFCNVVGMKSSLQNEGHLHMKI